MAKVTGKPKTKRVYSQDMLVDSDTFKLEVENYAKNVSYDDKNPLIVGVPHCHFFHTYDSSGKPMIYSNAVGGHHHKITVEEDEQGNLIAKCGPAIYSNNVKSEKLNDSHTHEVNYLKSDRFKVRKMHEEAAKFIANYDRI